MEIRLDRLISITWKYYVQYGLAFLVWIDPCIRKKQIIQNSNRARAIKFAKKYTIAHQICTHVRNLNLLLSSEK